MTTTQLIPNPIALSVAVTQFSFFGYPKIKKTKTSTECYFFKLFIIDSHGVARTADDDNHKGIDRAGRHILLLHIIHITAFDKPYPLSIADFVRIDASPSRGFRTFHIA